MLHGSMSKPQNSICCAFCNAFEFFKERSGFRRYSYKKTGCNTCARNSTKYRIHYNIPRKHLKKVNGVRGAQIKLMVSRRFYPAKNRIRVEKRKKMIILVNRTREVKVMPPPKIARYLNNNSHMTY